MTGSKEHPQFEHPLGLLNSLNNYFLFFSPAAVDIGPGRPNFPSEFRHSKRATSKVVQRWKRGGLVAR